MAGYNFGVFIRIRPLQRAGNENVINFHAYYSTGLRYRKFLGSTSNLSSLNAFFKVVNKQNHTAKVLFFKFIGASIVQWPLLRRISL